MKKLEFYMQKRFQTLASSIYPKVASLGSLSILLISSALTICVSISSVASADTLGYPWPTDTQAPCEFGSNGGSSCTNPNNQYDKYDWYVGSVPFSGNPCGGSNPSIQCFRDGYEYRNCTDYTQWKEATDNISVPSNWGNGGQWYGNAPTSEQSTTPKAWDAAVVPGNPGHVAFVESVNTDGTITVSEYNHDAQGHGDTRTGTASSMGFTEFVDFGVHPGSGGGTPSTPSAVSRGSNDMDVFYNDGNNNIVNFKWNSTSGWSSHTISDSTNGVSGQPAVVSRTSDSTDTFYYTPNHKLMNIGWTASGSWTGPTQILGSGVYGDPAVVARDANDMQVFFEDGSGNIKSIYWTASGSWNTNLQQLYGPGAAGDPYAISRTSDSMDAFFVKNNENLVHLGWTAASGWNTSDWTTYMVGKPTAITWNSGNDMAAFYEQINGNVGEESWDSVNSWAAQTWAASLSGNPSAVAGVSNTIDNFYRETGGNIVDRYLSGSTWATTNIVGSNGSTSNPFAITRGTSEEVFYWNGTSLMDNNWNTTSQTWNGGAQIN